jgi:O-methyltransferase
MSSTPTIEKPKYSPDMDEATIRLFEFVQPYTMTGIARVAALRQAVQYVAKNQIPGAIVECGVWKGGSMMAAAKTLLGCRAGDRELFLFDTFEGMTDPTEVDADLGGVQASHWMEESDKCCAGLDEVQRAMGLTAYDPARIRYVKGKVEETIPAHAPDRIALLRLDTDWYESTYHELLHLYPKLSVGGVLIIDDYGHWQGARRAVDQYIAEHKLKLLLNRIDYTARICIKIED